MRRYLLIALGAAVLVWGVLALALGSADLKLSGSGSTSASASPPCLRGSSTLDRISAALPGTSVDVSPAPDSGAANPHTQISFLGARASEISSVSVHGERSGAHAGRLQPYSQGDGASFVPSEPFDAGERVSVSISIDGKPVSYSFSTDTPYPTEATPDFHNPKAAPADYESFYSMPGVQAPILTVTKADQDPSAGDVFTTNGPGPGQYGPLIYSPQGRLVWFGDLPGAQTAEDLNVQEYEGRPALTWWKGRVLEFGFGQGEDLVMNSRYEVVKRLPGGNGLHADLHEFQIQPHDVAYITAFNPVRCDTTSVGGAKDGTITDTAVQEIDMSTGLVRWEWHSLDHVAAGESEVEASKTSTPWDYFHINSIDQQPDGNLLISARSTWAAYQLQKGSGQILWRLGGSRSSFKMGPGTRTAWQHDARMLPDGEITLFDDGANPPIHHESRGLRIKLDLADHTARLTADYRHSNPPLLAASQGNMQTLPDGNSLLGYGGLPAISEYSSQNGSLLYDAHLPFDFSFYRAFRHPWNATPATPPALVSMQNDTGEETIVHVSWNGATGVARWRVLGGSKPGSLSTQATLDDESFETEAILPKSFAYVQVQALDASGKVLGGSKTVKTVGFYASLVNARAGE
jgi:Arylsulfotransferase (ASST)